MNPMMAALQKKLAEKKGMSDHNSAPDHDSEAPSEDDAGMAPSLDHDVHAESDVPGMLQDKMPKENMPHMQSSPMHGEAGYEGSPMQMNILKALGDHGTMGRGPMSLSEKAGAAAKEKMAAIEQHKMGKK